MPITKYLTGIPVNVDLSLNIDFKLLRKQKRLIYAMSKKTKNKSFVEAIEGIVALIDGIQDEAVESGQLTKKQVFGK